MSVLRVLDDLAAVTNSARNMTNIRILIVSKDSINAGNLIALDDLMQVMSFCACVHVGCVSSNGWLPKDALDLLPARSFQFVSQRF